jgi:hypothetical protein
MLVNQREMGGEPFEGDADVQCGAWGSASWVLAKRYARIESLPPKTRAGNEPSIDASPDGYKGRGSNFTLPSSRCSSNLRRAC